MSIEQSKIDMWMEKGLTLRDRFKEPPANQRSSVSDGDMERSLARGDISQRIRLKYYPSIELDFMKYYAGSLEAPLEEVEGLLYQLGFRNNPTAYVEVTDKFGPDDGSFSKQLVTEDEEFPYLGIGRPFGIVTWWNRVKLQYHVTTFVDENSDLVHLLCHMEASAWLQPARHLTISEASGVIGVRDFRDFWVDEFGEKPNTPLGPPANKRE